MELLESVREITRAGRFTDALDLLERTVGDTRGGTESELLRLELFGHVGRHNEASMSAERLLARRNLTDVQRSICEFVLGIIQRYEGATQSATVHLQRSLSFAESANNLFRTCWSQLWLTVTSLGCVHAVSGEAECPQVGRPLHFSGPPHIRGRHGGEAGVDSKRKTPHQVGTKAAGGLPECLARSLGRKQRGRNVVDAV
jgi:hypothetical protein